jgi:3-hydroxybutyrate dehydrogenase
MVTQNARKAIVTGAAHGIGAEVAASLAGIGVHVTLIDRDGAAARERAETLGGDWIEIDLADSEAVESLAKRGLQADILINNAGFQHVAQVQDFPLDVFDTMHRVMVQTPFQLIRAVLPGMYRNGWGRIVNISSIHGIRASAFKVGYVSAKHALEGLTKVVALEAAPHGVTCNSICPTYVRTRLVENQVEDLAAAHGEDPKTIVDRVLLADSAIKRLLEPQEIAEAVLYLCSPGAQSITGTRIVMDGGRSAH